MVSTNAPPPAKSVSPESTLSLEKCGKSRGTCQWPHGLLLFFPFITNRDPPGKALTASPLASLGPQHVMV